MKVIAYNISPEEKEQLVLANHKKHDITVIANKLTPETLKFSEGKEAILVFKGDQVTMSIIKQLQEIGIKYITTASFTTNHIDLKAAGEHGLKVANIPFSENTLKSSAENIFLNMQQVIKNLNQWDANKCVGKACCCMNNCAEKTTDK